MYMYFYIYFCITNTAVNKNKQTTVLTLPHACDYNKIYGRTLYFYDFKTASWIPD